MGAIQAQDYGQAVWAIASRLKNGTIQDVERDIQDGKILRTWPMRGTIHFVPAEDAVWMVELTGKRMLVADRRRQDQLDLNQAIIDRCGSLLQTALKGRKLMSRPDVMDLFESNSISTKGQRGYHILWALAHVGLICIGPMMGKQQSIVLLREWVPNSLVLSHEDSMALLAKRYIQSHGPVTIRDFATWTKFNLSEARQAFELAKGVECVDIDGVQYWQSKVVPNGKPKRIYYLAAFDEYFLGYKDRSAIIHADHFQKVVPGNNGVFSPLLVVDGQAAGTWRRTIKKRGVDVEVTTFEPLQVAAKELEDALLPYEHFLGQEATLTVRSAT